MAYLPLRSSVSGGRTTRRPSMGKAFNSMLKPKRKAKLDEVGEEHSVNGAAQSISGDSHFQQLATNGFSVIPSVLDPDRCRSLASSLASCDQIGAGSRNLIDAPWCRELAGDLRPLSTLNGLLPADAVAVQCTLFDKSPVKNWLGALHQDLSIPVKRWVDSPACSGWSEKEGCVYVQMPGEFLEQLVAIRVHVDECPAESGPLRVVPGSHSFGRLNAKRVEALRLARSEVIVPVPQGGALIMRPLILHASSKAVEPRLRRVLHFVFGPPRLPHGLEWRWAV